MNDESDGVAESLGELASEARRRQGPDAHPTPETLTAYHAGDLTPAAAEDVQEHLAVCPHCARLLLDLPAFLEAPAADLETLDVEADASWRAIRVRLPGPPQTAGRRREPMRAWGAAQGTPRQAWPRLAVAATFAGVALIAVPLWIIARQLASPELAPATLELSTPEGQRGTAKPPKPPPATVHVQAASTTFLLRLARPQPDLHFRLELLAGGAAGETGAPASRALPAPAVTIVDARTLVLVLARRQLSPGSYRLRVLDAEQPAAEPLGDFQFQVVEP
jgi:Putative zinc-finger